MALGRGWGGGGRGRNCSCVGLIPSPCCVGCVAVVRLINLTTHSSRSGKEHTHTTRKPEVGTNNAGVVLILAAGRSILWQRRLINLLLLLLLLLCALNAGSWRNTAAFWLYAMVNFGNEMSCRGSRRALHLIHVWVCECVCASVCVCVNQSKCFRLPCFRPPPPAPPTQRSRPNNLWQIRCKCLRSLRRPKSFTHF